MPTEAVMSRRYDCPPPVSNGTDAMLSRRRSAMTSAVSTSVSGRTTKNSSPPYRHARSIPRMVRQNPLGELADNFVPDVVTVGIVYRLEAINISDQHRKRPLPGDGPIDQHLHMRVEIASVIETGQRIGDGQFDRVLHTRTQATSITLVPSGPVREFLDNLFERSSFGFGLSRPRIPCRVQP